MGPALHARLLHAVGAGHPAQRAERFMDSTWDAELHPILDAARNGAARLLVLPPLQAHAHRSATWIPSCGSGIAVRAASDGLRGLPVIDADPTLRLPLTRLARDDYEMTDVSHGSHAAGSAPKGPMAPVR